MLHTKKDTKTYLLTQLFLRASRIFPLQKVLGRKLSFIFYILYTTLLTIVQYRKYVTDCAVLPLYTVCETDINDHYGGGIFGA